MKLDSIVLESKKLYFTNLNKYDTIHILGLMFPIDSEHWTDFIKLFILKIKSVGLPIPSL